jgi:FtsH-binding integral membrane protein
MRTDTLFREKSEVLVNEFVRSVYNWMAVGLLLTGFVAWYVSSSESMMRMIYGNSFVLIGLILV